MQKRLAGGLSILIVLSILSAVSTVSYAVGPAAKIWIELPAQAFASGTGVFGTPDFSSYQGDVLLARAGVSFPIHLYITDANDTLVFENGSRDIDFATTALSSPDGTQPTVAGVVFPASDVSTGFTNGESTIWPLVICYDYTDGATSVKITASDNSGTPTLTGVVSDSFAVRYGNTDHINWTDASGVVTTTPINVAQTAGTPLPTLYVAALDPYDNVDASYAGVTIITLGSLDAPPENSPSGTGQNGANAPNGDAPPDYGTSSTWTAGILELSSSDVNQRTIIYAATSVGFRIRAQTSTGLDREALTPDSDTFTVNPADPSYVRVEDAPISGSEYLNGTILYRLASYDFYSVAYDIYGNWADLYLSTMWASSNFSPLIDVFGSSVRGYTPDDTTTDGTLICNASDFSMIDRIIPNIIVADTTKPATVQAFDIVEYLPDQHYVQASWDTASSYDDGNDSKSGPVADFDVRFISGMPISDGGAWNAANTVGTAGKPAFNAGSWLIYMGDKLPGAYYYAIKTVDAAGNWSDIGSGCFTTETDYSLLVALSDFRAQGGYGKIVVSWSTESEVDALGFNLLRDVSEDFDNSVVLSSYKTNPELKCQGTSASGFDYSFVDRSSVEVDLSYYYKLEVVDVNHRAEQCDRQATAAALPLPIDYALGPNFPNPFNPETRFQLQLPEDGVVSVMIYNSWGQEVARILANQFFEAGVHLLHWDGRSDYGLTTPSGVYFARLQARDVSKVMKMLLLK